MLWGFFTALWWRTHQGTILFKCEPCWKHYMYRGTFVYNIYLIRINDSVSYQVAKISIEYWKRHGMINYPYLGTGHFLCDRFKNTKFYKECLSSLALLSPRHFADNSSLWHPIAKSQKFDQLLVLSFTNPVNVWSKFALSMMPSLCRVIC